MNVKEFGGHILKLPQSASDRKLFLFLFQQNELVPSRDAPKLLMPSGSGLKSRISSLVSFPGMTGGALSVVS